MFEATTQNAAIIARYSTIAHIVKSAIKKCADLG